MNALAHLTPPVGGDIGELTLDVDDDGGAGIAEQVGDEGVAGFAFAGGGDDHAVAFAGGGKQWSALGGRVGCRHGGRRLTCGAGETVEACTASSGWLDFPAEEQMSEAEMVLDVFFVHGDLVERRQSASIGPKEKDNWAEVSFIN